MGKTLSKPKAPKPIKIVTPTVDTAALERKAAEEAAKAREEERRDNLLRRARGRAGTILTSTSGFLEAATRDGTTASARKTLLGE
ncbi:MAG: hypothetical protein AB7E85_02020 [Pseudobdellovibrionaceae bacterium]